jgi:hypothetical protein
VSGFSRKRLQDAVSSRAAVINILVIFFISLSV